MTQTQPNPNSKKQKDEEETQPIPELLLREARPINKQSIKNMSKKPSELQKNTIKTLHSMLLETQRRGIKITEKIALDTYRNAKIKARQEYIEKHKEKKCPIEVQEIKSFISLFENYDLDDPRIVLSIKALLRMNLSSLRLQMESNSSELINMDDRGNLSVNPAEKLKLKYDKEILSGTKKMFDLIDDEKINVEVTGNIGVPELLESLRKSESEDSARFIEDIKSK